MVWFRNDLRLADNPALHAAAGSGRPVAALYLHDTESPGIRVPGAAQRWMLHHALVDLRERLIPLGIRLLVLAGPAETVVPDLVGRLGVGAVFWNRRHGPGEPDVDSRIMAALRSRDVEVASHLANLLHEPSRFLTGGGTPWRVFTPFWRAFTARQEPRAPLPAPGAILACQHSATGMAVEDLGLLPRKPDWAGGLRQAWEGGETGAGKRLAAFLRNGLNGYAQGRDFPGRDHVSRLSAYLRFGAISPYQAWHAASRSGAPAADIAKFRAELGWREFCWHLLFHNPDLATRNFSRPFDVFPFEHANTLAAAWQRGQTGYPIVDAGMRQLWRTGWMHNRVRMIVASFLTKHLLIDWRHGEQWFWDTLVDGDPASNPAGWQWVAGCGADAAPYFRIFNPTLQAARFDPDGAYVRKFVPEIARLPDRHIHAPWLAPDAELHKAGIRLGETYPAPLVDHDQARARALHAYQSMKQGQ